jgi:hypothetical protein
LVNNIFEEPTETERSENMARAKAFYLDKESDPKKHNALQLYI